MSLARILWLSLQLGESALALAWFAVFRRGRTLVFAHAADVDREGKDRQLGPLVDALVARGRTPVEVVHAPLDRTLLHELARRRRLFVTHAALLAVARALALLPGLARTRARVWVGGTLLALTAPNILYLIDESGSGQLLLRAARRRGTRTIGIQHGDFLRTDPWYERAGAAARGVEPADVLAVWSPWFRARLFAISDIYDESNTRVVGRMRYDEQADAVRNPQRGTTHTLSVLLVSESRADFASHVAPFLEILRKELGARLSIRPHPAEPPDRWSANERTTGSLASAIEEADVVVGVASSALLEALAARRPALVLGPEDPAGYVSAGVLSACVSPDHFLEALRSFEESEGHSNARPSVWAGAPVNTVQALLALAIPDAAPPETGKSSERASTRESR